MRPWAFKLDLYASPPVVFEILRIRSMRIAAVERKNSYKKRAREMERVALQPLPKLSWSFL